jgi:hypothetical protein
VVEVIGLTCRAFTTRGTRTSVECREMGAAHYETARVARGTTAQAESPAIAARGKQSSARQVARLSLPVAVALEAPEVRLSVLAGHVVDRCING